MIEMESFLSDPTDPATKLWKEIMDERKGSPTPLASEALHAAQVAQERRDHPAYLVEPGKGPTVVEEPLAVNIMALQADIKSLMLGRHEKYGPGNIAEFGETGILVRMADKFARLKEGNKNYDDETVDNTLDDIIGYALIWKLWRRGEWPGSK